MLKIITFLIDTLFPPRETELRIRRHKGAITPQYAPNYHEGIVFLCQYHQPLIQALIKENKYHQHRTAALLLSTLLSLWLQRLPSSPTYLVPIPQSKERAKQRGYNQVEHILTQLQLPPHVQVCPSLITKERHTPTQTSLARNERIQNVTGSFSCNESKLKTIPDGATIVIVDDVVTTGATLKAARASLAPHLPKGTAIILLALAH